MNTLISGNLDKTVFCQMDLDDAKVKQFKDAIENNYWFEFFMGMLFVISFLYLLLIIDKTTVLMDNQKKLEA